MKKAFLILILLFSSSFSSFSQIDKLSPDDKSAYNKLLKKPLQGFFGLSFTNAVPQNQFYDQIQRAGQGISIWGGYRFDPLPFSVGMQGDILWFGGDERYHDDRVYTESGHYVGFYQDTLSYQNMVIPISFFGRIEPNINNFIFPYLQANLGFSIFSATSSIDYGYADYNNKSNSEIDAAWHYGASGGVQVKLVDFVHLPNTYSRMLLDIGFKYIKGTEAELYTVGLDSKQNTVFQSHTTKTDLLMFQIGIVFQF